MRGCGGGREEREGSPSPCRRREGPSRCPSRAEAQHTVPGGERGLRFPTSSHRLYHWRQPRKQPAVSLMGFSRGAIHPRCFYSLSLTRQQRKIRRRVYDAQPWVSRPGEPLGRASSFFRIHRRPSWCAGPDVSALGEPTAPLLTPTAPQSRGLLATPNCGL